MMNRRRFGVLRILFGFAWAIDASFKWQPTIRDNIIGVLTQARDGQPLWEQTWINVWVHIASINPEFFGILIASVETALALSLITGVLSRTALYLGVPFALLIWSVPQGFGGPYGAGTTDIDSGIIYALLFIALIFGRAWERYDLYNLLPRRLHSRTKKAA